MIVSEIIEQFNKLETRSGGFLQNLLAAQCFLGQAKSGAILRINPDKKADILALYPQIKSGTAAPEWLIESLEFTNQKAPSDNYLIKSLKHTSQSSQEPVDYHILIIPVIIPDIGKTIGAFLIAHENESVLEEKVQKLQLSTGMINLSQSTIMQQDWRGNCLRLQKAMETLAAVNQEKKFKSTVMAFCNETASQWLCDRVSIGFLKGRYVRLKAMSHTENFSRRMKVVQDIESAMEECLDQDTEILCPAPRDSAYISRASNILSKGYGPQTVLSLPLRKDGKVIAVLTLERPLEKGFSKSDIETIRLACELCTPRIANLYERDKWFGASIASKSRKLFGLLLGSQYTWAKLVTLLCIAAVVFLSIAEGQFRVKSSFVLEATYQQVVPAPFDGFIESVEVEIGNSVEAGKTLLAKLETTDLELDLGQAQAKKNSLEKQAQAYRNDNKTAEALIADEQANEVEAQIQYLEYQISQASLISPMSGVVVKGDLKRQIGAPVKIGDVLFEVCPLEALRAQLLVPEDQIFDIQVGQEGELALVSYPGRKIKFVVERINPIAQVEDQRNIFKVRVQLQETYPGMRPGMEGIAKVTIGKRKYAWIWSRKIVNWVRMKLWL